MGNIHQLIKISKDHISKFFEEGRWDEKTGAHFSNPITNSLSLHIGMAQNSKCNKT